MIKFVLGLTIGMTLIVACDEVMDAVPEWTAKRLIIIDPKDFTPSEHPVDKDGNIDIDKLKSSPTPVTDRECYIEEVNMKTEEIVSAWRKVPYERCHNNWMAMTFDDWDSRSVWYNDLLQNIKDFFK